MSPKRDKSGIEFVDILDAGQRRLAVMSRREAKFQGLNHREVLLTLGDSRRRACIRRRGTESRIYPGRLDLIASGHVRSGEAAYDAACRYFLEQTGFPPPGMHPIRTIHSNPETDFRTVHFFSAGRIKQPSGLRDPETASFLFLDPEELEHLVLEMPDQLTPSLIFAWRKKLVFSFA
ncbi:MAG: NUDIX domain-containing protein [Desulfonatronovibrionaceae bacterium]